MLPRISVVTCSYNQGRYIGRTIASVLAQDYPNLEHIVVDGMSTDETPAVLSRYPHLRVVREPDGGQAEAINKGFRLATGDIFAFLNSDDLLFPGALHRVAREIDPARGRHVVMGRCAFIDEDDRPTGQEHPCAYRGHQRLLQVWAGHYVPQPATFWTRAVWQACGPLDEREHLVLDYDLMCRISRRYRLHPVNQVLAGYRLHAASKSCSHDPDEVYDTATRVSRRYWGPWWLPRYWHLRAALALFRFEQRHGRRRQAAECVVRAFGASLRGERGSALADLARAAALAPEVALRRFLLRRVAPLLRPVWPGGPSLAHTWQDGRYPERTTVWRSFRGVYPDGAVGPHYATAVELGPGSRRVHLDGVPMLRSLPEPLDLEVSLDGRVVLRHRQKTGEPFRLTVPVAGLAPGSHRLEVKSRTFLVLDDVLGDTDYRPVAFRLAGVHVAGAAAAGAPGLAA